MIRDHSSRPEDALVTHRALQQALVIALHDETFVAEMHADPDRTHAPLGLGARQREQLLAVDRRASRTDPRLTLSAWVTFCSWMRSRSLSSPRMMRSAR